MENLLNLSNPDEVNCYLLSYARGHSEMYIEIYISNEIQYVFLDGVQYFAGPRHWQGANFHLGTDKELTDLLGSFKYLRQFLDETVRKNHSLYIITTKSNEEIKIIGHKDRLFLVKELPDHVR